VTVAVLPEPKPTEVRVDERDLEWQYFRGSGNGGQKKNKTSSAVRCKHSPSGLVVRVESERSQLQNKELAMAMLRARLFSAANQNASNSRASLRRKQVGSGMRADKIRTVQCQNGQVVDHASDWRIPLRKYLRGFW
jgi:peptide chain release factor 1